MGSLVIMGGGQLARMSALAASRLGLDVGVVVRPDDDSLATAVVAHRWTGDWEDPALLGQVAAAAAAVTVENEFVAAGALAFFEQRGIAVHPSSRLLATVQDKLTQKDALRRAGLPVTPQAAVTTVADVAREAETLGWPLVLKTRRNGYDGYGNLLLREPLDVEPALQKFGTRGELMVERFVPFTRELAVMVARGRDGVDVTYPVVETVQHAHMCHTVLAPAPVSEATARAASDVARRVVRALDGVGVFGVELFLLGDGEVLVNEVAPRPHNSGHYTIEACATSQFENHVRAVMGWPLGPSTMTVPAAAMVNILGAHRGPTEVKGLAGALAVPGATVHLYGKRQCRAGRKMGHATAVGATVDEARERALQAARAITL